MQLSAVSVFKTPEITSTVEILSSEASANGLLQNNCCKQRLKLPGRCAGLLEKDFTIDVFFIRNFERQKQKLRKKRKFFCNADVDADVNANADPEMLMPRFPNGPISV